MHLEGIEFGSHTLNHPVVSRLSPLELDHQLRESKLLLERNLGRPVRHFAYPFGQPDDCGTNAREVLVRNGYCTAATTCSGVNGPSTDPYRLARVSVASGRSLEVLAWRLNQVFLGAVVNNTSPGQGWQSRTQGLGRAEG